MSILLTHKIIAHCYYSAHTHTLDHFVEPHVSNDEEHDYAQDEQLRTKRKNCPQMALFLAFNGDKNCEKPVYTNFHTFEVKGDTSNKDDSNSDLNQLDIQPPLSDIDDATSLDHTMGNYLMDKLLKSGEIVPNNASSDQQRPSSAEEPKDEIGHKYEELMSAMHLVLEKMNAPKVTKQPEKLDEHTDDNEYGIDPDAPQTVTDDYGPIIELPKSKSPLSKNWNKYRLKLDIPAKKATKISSSETMPAEPETTQPIVEDESDEDDPIYEEDEKDGAEYPKSNNGMSNKNRNLGNYINGCMTNTEIQDQLKKFLGISCECSKDRDFPAEGNDITLNPQTSDQPTQRYKRPRSGGKRKNHSCPYDGTPKKLKRTNRRTESPNQNYWNSNYFDRSYKDGSREEFIQKKSIPFATELIPERQRGSKRKESNSNIFDQIDEEWSEDNMEDIPEKFNRNINIKSNKERKTKLRSKSSCKEEEELKMDLVQMLAQILFSAKTKKANNKIRAITKSPVSSKSNSRRSKSCDSTESLSRSDQNQNEYMKELLIALTDEIPEDTSKGLPENEDEEDDVTNLPNSEFKRNRSNMQNFVKPNHIHLERNGETDDDYTELQRRGNYRPSIRTNRPKIERADGADEDKNEEPDVEAVEKFNDAQSEITKKRTVSLSNQRRINSIETDDEDIEASDDDLEKENVAARKLYHSQHLKPSIPRGNKIQFSSEVDVVDTEKAASIENSSGSSRVYSPLPRTHSKRVQPNYRQKQNISKLRPRIAKTEPLQPLDDIKFKDKLCPAKIQKSRKSYENNSKTPEKLPASQQRRIVELPEILNEGDNNLDDDGDEINDHEFLSRPINPIKHRIPRPLSSNNQQRFSSGEVKSSNELHILFNDPATESMDEDVALEDTEEDQPLPYEELAYFRNHKNIRRKGRTMESENTSRPGNRINGRNQPSRRRPNAFTKSQRQRNDRRKEIVHREERGLYDRKRLQLLNDDKKSRNSNEMTISDSLITPKTDLAIDTSEVPVLSNRIFANGKKLSVVDPTYMDDKFLIYPELINDQMDFNPLEPSQDVVKKQIQKKVVPKLQTKLQDRIENQQMNQTVTTDTPTTTINHQQARRYLNLFNNFKERVSLVTKKPAHAKYYRGYPPGVEKYAANYN